MKFRILEEKENDETVYFVQRSFGIWFLSVWIYEKNHSDDNETSLMSFKYIKSAETYVEKEMEIYAPRLVLSRVVWVSKRR